MAHRTDPEAPQFVTLLPWQIRIAFGVTFLVVMFAAIMAVPGGPWNVWGALV
ncbi:hypothetical protein [Kocuria aegyptia]|uniref:Uncharacterized protein n=1 Tax=Kocuria aegyptia TaxID=330943 RepID=A0ABN2KJ44_9MICC